VDNSGDLTPFEAPAEAIALLRRLWLD